MRVHTRQRNFVDVRIAVLSGIFFLSGISALIFETLWLRVSGLAFGNSVWAAALILSSFMAGLALGSAIAACLRLGRWRALRVYASLEALVAISGCTLVFAIPLLGSGLRPLFQLLWTHHATLNGLRFCLSFLILLVPTTAMGLTLPIVLEDPVAKARNFNWTLGLLYGCNTLGAVLGALLTEGYLVEARGLFGTAVVAALLSLTAAGIAWLLAKGDGGMNRLSSAQAITLTWPNAARLPWRLLLLSFGAGSVVLCLEVTWFRFLHLYVASSSVAFSVMLAVALAGIGLGGLAAGMLPRRVAGSRQLLTALLMLAAAATLLCYWFFPAPSAAPNRITSNLRSWQEIAWLAFALLFPVTFLSGMLLPSIAAAVQRTVENRTNSTGTTIFFNTTGAAVGPLLASFFLLPKLGFQWTLIICAIAFGLLSLLGSDRTTWSLRRPSGLAMIGLGVLVVGLLLFFPYRRDEMHFGNARRPYEVDGSHLVKEVEGSADTLQLLRDDFLGQPYYYRLLTNGFSMSSTHPRSQRYMRLFAYLPLALRPQTEDVLLICYGVGVTADAFVHDGKLKRIDIVDTSKEVFDLADCYQGVGEPKPLVDPRVQTYVQDGRFFLQASPAQYDVITGEPPPLKVMGTVNLYTTEFFSLMRERLKPGGIASFWLPIYQLKVEETKAILAAFHRAFPNASVWGGSDDEWIMLGIKDPKGTLHPGEPELLWKAPSTRMDLIRSGLEVPEQLAALFLMDSEEIARITEDVRPLTDSYPKRLSDARPDPDAVRKFATPYMEASSAGLAFRSSPLIKKIWPDAGSPAISSAFVLRETRYRSIFSGSNWLAELDLYLRHSSLQTPVLEVLNSDPIRVAIAHQVAGATEPIDPKALPDLIADALARRDFSRAIALLEEKENRSLGTASDMFLLTYIYCLNGDVEKAEAFAAAHAQSVDKDWFMKWLWGDLQAQFGFRPPS